MVTMFAPTVSDLKQDGTRVIGVYDDKENSYKNYKVPAQEVDKFLSERKNAMKKANTKTGVSLLLGILLGSIGGYKFSKVGEKAINSILGGLIGFIAGGLTAVAIGGSTERAEAKVSRAFILKNQNQKTA